MHALDEFKAARDRVKQTYAGQTSATLSTLLLIAAVIIILIALFVRNPVIKAAVLAYVTLP